MDEKYKAREQFRFFTRMHLSELTGLRASTLSQLLALIKEIPGASIYHHTHRFLLQYQYLSPEPPNDFAYWVSEALGEDELGEKLTSIDTIQYSTIRSLREKVIQVIELYLKDNPLAKLKFASPGEEFHFIKSISFVLATNYTAGDLKEFAQVLDKITLDSIYYHIFEARLRLERSDNDFSNWIEHSLGNKELAQKISRLDPYSYTLEELRKNIIALIKKQAIV